MKTKPSDHVEQIADTSSYVVGETEFLYFLDPGCPVVADRYDTGTRRPTETEDEYKIRAAPGFSVTASGARPDGMSDQEWEAEEWRRTHCYECERCAVYAEEHVEMTSLVV